MPPLDGATEWLNSEPLDPAGLRGKVVLVDFWTLTCINWLRTEPYVRAWSQAYRDDGLVVIGVHTPEFTFEREVDLIRKAIEERDIDYPVAVDSDYEVWNAFANHYWPALYFIDTEGIIRDHHFGEGEYDAVRAADPAAARDRARVRLRRRRRRGGRSRLAEPAHARDVSRLRPWRGHGLARRSAPQRVGPERRLDDRWRERRPQRGRREHRLPVPRTRRASGADRGASEPIPFRVLLDGEAAGRVARRGRRRRTAPAARLRAACTS